MEPVNGSLREKKASKLEQSGLTEEDFAAQPEALFAASRARFEATPTQ